jgi:DnaJ-like protein/uncharacterized protein DUF3592
VSAGPSYLGAVAYTRTRDWATVDYYGMLGLEPGATEDEIARAYRLLAKELHPDVAPPVDGGDRFKELTRAYEVLGNPRTRRDYDSVRAGLLPRPRPRVQEEPSTPRFGDGPPPRFRASQQRNIGWTRRRAWLACVGGIVVLALGIAMSLFTIALQHHDSALRAGRVAVKATRVTDHDRPFIDFRTSDGQVVHTREPEQQNPGVRGSTVAVLYDPAHPSDVIADENYLARNITFWIVAIKLLVGGPVFAVLGGRALRRLRVAR